MEGGNNLLTSKGFYGGITDFPLDASESKMDECYNMLVREDGSLFLMDGCTLYDATSRTNPSSSFLTTVKAEGAIHSLFLMDDKLFVGAGNKLFSELTTPGTWEPVEFFGDPLHAAFTPFDYTTGTLSSFVSPMVSSYTFSYGTFITANEGDKFNRNLLVLDDATLLDSGVTQRVYNSGVPTPKEDLFAVTFSEVAAFYKKLHDIHYAHTQNLSMHSQAQLNATTSETATTFSLLKKGILSLRSSMMEHMSDARLYPVNSVFHAKAGVGITSTSGFTSFLPREANISTLEDCISVLEDLTYVHNLHLFDFQEVSNRLLHDLPPIPAITGRSPNVDSETPTGQELKAPFAPSSGQVLFGPIFYPYNARYNVYTIGMNGSGVTGGVGYRSDPLYLVAQSLRYTLETLMSHISNAPGLHTGNQYVNDIKFASYLVQNMLSTRADASFYHDELVAMLIIFETLWNEHTRDNGPYHSGTASDPTKFVSVFKSPNNGNTDALVHAPLLSEDASAALFIQECNRIFNFNNASIGSGNIKNCVQIHAAQGIPWHPAPTTYNSSLVDRAEYSSMVTTVVASKTISDKLLLRSNPYTFKAYPYLLSAYVNYTPSSGTSFGPATTYLKADHFPGILKVDGTGYMPIFEQGFLGYEYSVYASINGESKLLLTQSNIASNAEINSPIFPFLAQDGEPYTSSGTIGNEAAPPAKSAFFTTTKAYYLNVLEREINPFSLVAEWKRYKNRVRISLDNQPGSTGPTFYVDMPEEVICGGHVHSRPVIVTKKAVYRLDGSFLDDGTGAVAYEEIFNQTGGVSHTGAVSVGDVVIFAGRDGFYATTGYSCKQISGTLPDSYKACDKDKIKMSYNRIDNSVYIMMAHSGVYDETWVLNLDYGIKEDACFTIIGNTLDLQNTACTFTDEGKLIRGNDYGYVFIHRSSDLSLPKLDSNTFTLLRDDLGGLITTHIPWDFKSPDFAFGSSKERKMITDWDVTMENISPSSSRQSVTFEPYFSDDKGRITGSLPIVRNISPANGLFMEKRKFKADTLTPLFKGLGMRAGSSIITQYSELPAAPNGTLTITVFGLYWKATLNNGATFPVEDMVGAKLYLDGVATGYDIIRSTSTYLVITGSPSLLMNKKWVVRGYPKTERFVLYGYNIPYTTYSSGKDVQRSGI